MAARARGRGTWQLSPWAWDMTASRPVGHGAQVHGSWESLALAVCTERSTGKSPPPPPSSLYAPPPPNTRLCLHYSLSCLRNVPTCLRNVGYETSSLRNVRHSLSHWEQFRIKQSTYLIPPARLTLVFHINKLIFVKRKL